jgi:hypothetical protein
MKKTMLVLAGAATLAMLAGGAYAQDKKELAVVVKGLDNPFFTVLGSGLHRLERRSCGFRICLHLQRPGAELRRSRRSAAGSGPDQQGCCRYRDLAVERSGHGQDAARHAP